MNERAEQLIELLKLKPHPEGGYFRETYRSVLKVHSPQTGHSRHAVTDIYFMLVKSQKSRLHRVLHDELWHFYEGAPLKLLEINKSQKIHSVILGNPSDTPLYQYSICGGNWQAAASTGDYSLVGCSVAPGFDYKDFTFLSDDSDTCNNILNLYPELRDWI